MSDLLDCEGFVVRCGTWGHEIAMRFLQDGGIVNEQLGEDYRIFVGDEEARRKYIEATTEEHRRRWLEEHGEEVEVG